jgi:hypothetical protein
MELRTDRQRRPRNRPRKTTGVIIRTINDARGIAEPLERYGELLTCQVVGLYNAIHGLPSRSAHTLARLKQLFHESEGLPTTSEASPQGHRHSKALTVSYCAHNRAETSPEASSATLPARIVAYEESGGLFCHHKT